MNHLTWRLALLCLLNLGLLAGCASDNEEDLNPQPNACDTSAVTFSGTVNAILQNNGCKNCHAASAGSGGVVLDSYAEVKKRADDGRLLGAISHASGYAPMPLGGTKLSDCDIAKVKKWIDNGAPNN
ncbi:hypothetical protein HUW51_04295 [Adhaeribacter swui]|uniref:Cytochrome c domain-containing protein n=1 Tax=Adhaeribacter swui TaxID=2086471 RepID=A0A7G7G499_9BACT|nr:hypothetical protein [Adhaeribacter swui]QNF31983.1 hypothetical protein HUW51_04295 [Adhaeribacter swui]